MLRVNSIILTIDNSKKKLMKCLLGIIPSSGANLTRKVQIMGRDCGGGGAGSDEEN